MTPASAVSESSVQREILPPAEAQAALTEPPPVVQAQNLTTSAATPEVPAINPPLSVTPPLPPLVQRAPLSVPNVPESLATEQRDMPSTPTPEVADTAPPSVEFDVPTISVAPSESVAQREMLSQPDVPETRISAPNVPPPNPELVETVPPSVEFAVPPISACAE